MLSLAACASRPPVARNQRVFSLTGVEVTAVNAEDRDFANRLRQRLMETAGRAGGDAGETASMAVSVRERGSAPLPSFISGEPRSFARVSVVVTATGDGRVLYSGSVRSVGLNAAADPASVSLITRLATDIRALLGLEGMQPRAIEGARPAVARSAYSPVAAEPIGVEMAPEIADPLLNGTITPISAPGSIADDAPVMDTARPLLSSEPDQQPGILPNTSATAAGIPVPSASPQQWSLRVPTPVARPADNEPCIVTLDTDCQAPGAN